MQRVLCLLILLILPILLFSGEQDGFAAQSDLRGFRTSELSVPGEIAVHPALRSIRYAFFPPRRSEAIYIRPSEKDVSELSLIFSGYEEERFLRLPASREGNIYKIALDGFPELTAISLSRDAGFYFDPPGGELFGAILPDRPEELILTLSGRNAAPENDIEPGDGSSGEGSEDELTNEDLVVSLTNPEAIRFSDVSGDHAVLRPHNRLRTFHFPFEQEDRKVISPLSGLESLSFHMESRQEFPAPLNREGMQILGADPAAWRNRDFEIYRWSSLPELLIFDCRNYDIQNRFFRRLAFFVEKKGYRGRILSNEELEGKHGWNANDYRAEDLAAFFNKAKELGSELYEEEIFLRETLVREGILIEEGERLKEGIGAINSLALESGPYLRYRFFTHEASHGIYFTQKKYRDFVKKYWDSLDEEDRDLWRSYMSWNAYDPEDEDLMMNEFQAYFTQQPVSDAADYFMPRMSHSARTSYPLRILFEKKKESLPELFQRWAEEIEHFQKENWGLEAGNFSPLQAETPVENK